MKDCFSVTKYFGMVRNNLKAPEKHVTPDARQCHGIVPLLGPVQFYDVEAPFVPYRFMSDRGHDPTTRRSINRRHIQRRYRLLAYTLFKEGIEDVVELEL